MSNLTLKEQLQALSLGDSHTEKKPSHKNAAKPKSTHSKHNKPKPAWLEQAQYGVELLKAYFPACFKEVKETQPLKIGIKQDLVKYLSTRDDIVISDKACMVNSLAYYVNSISYHKNAIAGAERIDLEGNAAGIVTAEEALYSSESRNAKIQKRKPSTHTTTHSEKSD